MIQFQEEIEELDGTIIENETFKSNCPPFSDCWCELHPRACDNNPPKMPINDNLIWLFLIGLVYFCLKIKYYGYSNKKNLENR